ncbi:hypothetical protein MBLNU230_g2818t1 [Neophaeotheca triangularis]
MRLVCVYGKSVPKTLQYQYEQTFDTTWQVLPRTQRPPQGREDITEYSRRLIDRRQSSPRAVGSDRYPVQTLRDTKDRDTESSAWLPLSPSANQSMLSILNASLENAYQRWDDYLSIDQPFKSIGTRELELLNHFQNRTLEVSFGASHVVFALRHNLLELCCTHPYLFHIVETLASMHDRHLKQRGPQKRTAFECYHWAQASSLFNSELSAGCLRGHATALWLVAGFLSAAVIFAVETDDRIESAWPLRKSESPSLDLQWLAMQRGLQRVWKIVRKRLENAQLSDDRNDGAVSPGCIGPGPKHPGLSAIPSDLIELCGFDKTTTIDNNPYYAPVGCLTSLLDLDLRGVEAMRFLIFPNTLSPTFVGLLQRKDAVALVLLALFYAKACFAPWWLALRAVTECTAICEYLDVHCADDERIMAVMQYPKKCCGYVAGTRPVDEAMSGREILNRQAR